jgi:hypothetical protein
VDSFLVLLADLFERSGHPDVKAVTVLDGAVKVDHADGSATFAKVAHTAPATNRVPDRPSWPGSPSAAVTPAPTDRRAR